MNAARAARIYRRLLLLLPAQYRAEAEPELVAVFRDAYARSRSWSSPRRAWFWLRTVADTLLTSVGARMDARRETAEAGGARRADGWLRGTGADVRHALRRLGREPAHALLPIITLGVGIAATVTVLTVVRGVLLKPLPFPQADRLVRLLERDERGGIWYPAYPNFVDWREHATVFSGVTAVDVPQVRPVLIGERAVRARTGALSRGFFETVGIVPALGRGFTEVENRPGGPGGALVSWAFWRGALGGRPIEDTRLMIGTETYPVVGVLPSGFRFLGDGAAWEDAEVWTPLERSSDLGGRQSHGYHVVARLREEASLDDARSALNQLAVRMKAEHGEGTQADFVQLNLLADDVVSAARRPLQLLLIAAAVVLLVACCNLAASVLARGLARERELAVRLALGARRASLARLLTVETLALAAPGAVLGAGLAWAALAALRAHAGTAIPRLDEISIDGMVLASAAGTAALAALLAGLLPALALSARDLAGRLHAARGSTAAREHRFLWSSFVAAQVALTVVLLIVAGLLLRSMVSALRLDLGYRPEGVLIAEVSLPELRYAAPESRASFYREALERLRAAPGVAAAGVTSVPPNVTTRRTASTSVVGDDSLSIYAAYRLADAGFFDAAGIPLLQGAELLPGAPGATTVPALVDRTLVRQLWRGASPVGDQVRNSFDAAPLLVAGVVGDVREWGQDNRFRGAVYVHYLSRPERLLEMHVLVRGAARPDSRLPSTVREVLRSVDPLVPVRIDPLDDLVAAALADRRLTLMIAFSFAVVALVLAAAGVHAVVAYAASRQLREMGIRLVLGARPARVRLGVLARGVRPVLAGAAIGLAIALAAAPLLRAHLFDVTPRDPLVLLSAPLLLVAAALAAGYLPAHRATRVDPAIVLRAD